MKQIFADNTDSKGFTIVEVVVTLFVLTLFLIGFFQSYLLLESQRLSVSRQAKASDIAYSNLRKYTTRPANLTTCDTAGIILGSTTQSGSASSYGFTAEPTDGLGSAGRAPTQEVKAFPTNGCDNTTSPSSYPPNSSIKIESTVTFGSNGDKVTHASFVQ